MKNIIYPIILICVVAIIGSCDDSFLDKEPLDQFSDESLWADPNLFEPYVFTQYDGLGHGWTESWESSCVDETYFTAERGTNPYTRGYVSASDLGRMNGGWYGWDHRSWGDEYAVIANCNLLLEKTADMEFADAQYAMQVISEVRFIRAMLYFDLSRRWGGVPLITKSYDLGSLEEAKTLKRNTYKEIVDFIVDECDTAAKYLPAKWEAEFSGRANSAAALALKSRMLLYAASPLMNIEGVNELVGFTSPDANRWQKTADAAQACIDLSLKSGYSLYDEYGDDVETKYRQMFLDGSNPEILFARKGGLSADAENLSYIDQTNGPNGFGQWGGNCPVLSFADAFEMADGSEFSWENATHTANPSENRDGRYKAIISSNGDEWMGRKIETFLFDAGTGTKGGLDTEYGSDSWNTSLSRMYMRKFIDEEYVPNSWNFTTPKHWIWFRLAEQYLNLAEALYNVGDEDGAREALNVIRDRARMPHKTSSGEELWNDIVNERRIELCMEEHRFCDVRRWMIAEDVLNIDARGIKVWREGDSEENYTFTYSIGDVVEERTFEAPRMYWMPIPQFEIDKNPNLEQNPFYE